MVWPCNKKSDANSIDSSNIDSSDSSNIDSSKKYSALEAQELDLGTANKLAGKEERNAKCMMVSGVANTLFAVCGAVTSASAFILCSAFGEIVNGTVSVNPACPGATNGTLDMRGVEDKGFLTGVGVAAAALGVANACQSFFNMCAHRDASNIVRRHKLTLSKGKSGE